MYKSLTTPQGVVLYRSDIKYRIENVDAIVFDVDGTLVNTLNSYNKAIYYTVNFFLKTLTNITIPEHLVMETIHKLRLTGGFNNDWDTTYAIIMGVLSTLDINSLSRIAKALSERGIPSQPAIQVESIDFISGLENVVNSVDSRGIASIEEWMRGLPKVKCEYLMRISKLLKYPNGIDESPLVQIFNEYYYGSKLYSKLTGRQPILNVSRGLIECEELIVKEETLRLLKDKTRGKLGIVTGRSRIATELVLKSILKKFFKPNALVFIEDLTKGMHRHSYNTISKPNPYTLRYCLKVLKPYKYAMYLGDSVEDALMAKRVNCEGELIFVGVYRYTINPESTIKVFMKLHVPVIIPTVNELAILMEGSL